MTDSPTLLLLECTQCAWQKHLHPNALHEGYQVEACSGCGSAETELHFLHRYPAFIEALAQKIDWPEPEDHKETP